MELKLETVATIIHQFKTLGNQGRQNALFDFIHALPDQQKIELTAIFWVGRDSQKRMPSFSQLSLSTQEGNPAENSLTPAQR
jgi:hypothetical protein